MGVNPLEPKTKTTTPVTAVSAVNIGEWQGEEIAPADTQCHVKGTLDREQLQILQHALGVDKYGQGEPNRNHFCAGGHDETVCRELVALGYMATFSRSYLPYYNNCTVTEAGKAAMAAESPKPPKLTRGQRRYREFLKADTGPFFW